MADIPDVTDPDIRELVLSTHGPYELREKFKLVAVVCGVCAEPWPCPSIQAAREADGDPGDFSTERMSTEGGR